MTDNESEGPQTDPSQRYQKVDQRIPEITTEVRKSIYKAYDTETAQELAWIEYENVPLKTITAIESKINVLTALEHDNILGYKAAWVNRKTKKVSFVTDAMPSGAKGSSVSNLRRFISRNLKMKKPVIRGWLTQILAGLHYLHSLPEPFIHYDLNLSNIFILSNTGTIKIGALENGIFILNSHPSSGFSATPGYMAPDFLLDSFSKSVDIYAFGICCLEIATQKPPFCGCKNAYQIFKKQLRGELPMGLDQLKDDKKDLILKCIAPTGERWTTSMLEGHKFFSAKAEKKEKKEETANVLDSLENAPSQNMSQPFPNLLRNSSDEQMLQKPRGVSLKRPQATVPSHVTSTTSSTNGGTSSSPASLTTAVNVSNNTPNNVLSSRGDASGANTTAHPNTNINIHANTSNSSNSSNSSNTSNLSNSSNSSNSHSNSSTTTSPNTKQGFSNASNASAASNTTQNANVIGRRKSGTNNTNVPSIVTNKRKNSGPNSLKCYFPTSPALLPPKSKCVRLYLDNIQSVEELKLHTLEDLGLHSSTRCNFHYVDNDNDLVSFTNRTSMEEIRKHAVTIHVSLNF